MYMAKTTEQSAGIMMNLPLNAVNPSLEELLNYLNSALNGQEDILKSPARTKAKRKSGKTGMKFTSLEEEIKYLLGISESLRNQIGYLEVEEAKIADKISIKRKQIDTQLSFNFLGE